MRKRKSALCKTNIAHLGKKGATMGGGAWDVDAYEKARRDRRASGADDFAYTSDLRRRSPQEWECHPLLDPKGITGVRESRDSDEHPESLGIAVFFDVTGSMGNIPRLLQQKLADLMDILQEQAGVANPQVLTGAIGDWYSDSVPLQVGQFESDNRIDEQLRLIFLEGRGGGTMEESYGLAYYVAGYKTALDCFEKRGKKGYLFTMGDERYYPTLEAEQLLDIFGDTAQSDVTIAEALAKTQEQYEVFHIIVTGGQHGTDPRVEAQWNELLGQRVLRLDNPELVCELIAATVASREGLEDISALGLSDDAKASVENALSGLDDDDASGKVGRI